MTAEEETLFGRPFQVPQKEKETDVDFVLKTEISIRLTSIFPIDIQMFNATLDPKVQTNYRCRSLNYRCRSLTIPFGMNLAAFEAVWKTGPVSPGADDITWKVQQESFVEWWTYTYAVNPLSVGIIVSVMLVGIITSNFSSCMVFVLRPMAKPKSLNKTHALRKILRY